MQRPQDGSHVTGFGSFDNSSCKRVLGLLDPGGLRLGQVVIKRVAVVKLGVNNGSGDVEAVLVSRYGRIQRSWRNSKIWRQMSCLLRPISRNSVVEEFSVRFSLNRNIIIAVISLRNEVTKCNHDN